jgi:hypothetical protein
MNCQRNSKPTQFRKQRLRYASSLIPHLSPKSCSVVLLMRMSGGRLDKRAFLLQISRQPFDAQTQTSDIKED